LKGVSLASFQSATIALEGPVVLPPPPPPLFTGSAPVGKQTLTVDYGDATLETFTYRPAGEINGVLLNFHGMGRNASGARDAAMEMADKHGFYVVAPLFDAIEFPSSMYQLGGLLSAGELRSQDDWTVSLVDEIAGWAHAQVGK
jgi:poly(3-hydroxybutyrate) depolymerase